MSLVVALKARLRTEEGQRLYAYRDRLGHLTIGDGFLLEGSHVALMQRLLGLSDLTTQRVVAGAVSITPGQCDFLLDYTVNAAITDAGDTVGRETWETLPFDAQLALADMCFQLGSGGLDEFQRMLAAVRLHPPDWATVEREANASQWDKQTPARADGIELLFHALIHPDVTDADRARIMAMFVPERPGAGAHASDDEPPPQAA